MMRFCNYTDPRHKFADCLSDELRALADDMLETMLAQNGTGAGGLVLMIVLDCVKGRCAATAMFNPEVG
jgi:peptide deformylase